MPRLTPISLKKLIARLSHFGFEGPFPGGKHSYMILGLRRIAIPNPHREEISVDLLIKILRQAGISREEWLK